MAPEMFGFKAPGTLESGYTENVDVWSIGCVALQIISGKMVWRGYERHELERNMLNVPSAPKYPDVLDVNMQDFLNCCFQIDRKLRSSAQNLLNHQIFKQVV
jgi:mitogen-activated protein kinase kinase kinase 4